MQDLTTLSNPNQQYQNNTATTKQKRQKTLLWNLSTPIPTIAVIGLGKLGIPIAVTIADKGFNVIGVDVVKATVDAINRRESPIYEQGVQELLNKNIISATTNLSAAVRVADIVVIIVPTPSDSTGGFSSQIVEEVCAEIGKALRKSPNYHLIVVSSTVMPTTIDNHILPLLERESGKKMGDGWGLCYSPFFVALGSVINDFSDPSFVLIGEADEVSGDVLERFYQCIYDGSTPIVRMNCINAEITKLVLNCFLVGRITYSNTIAQMCERVAGADADVVSQAIGLDRRIGPKLLKGATAFAGPCYPRDVVALSTFERSVRLNGKLPAVFSEINAEMTMRLMEFIEEVGAPRANVGILGLSYKPDTDVVEESPSITLARLFSKTNCVFVYDPAAMDNARLELGDCPNIHFCENAQQVISASYIVYIMTAWDSLKGIEPLFIWDDTVVVDCWRILDKEKFPAAVKYIALGVGE